MYREESMNKDAENSMKVWSMRFILQKGKRERGMAADYQKGFQNIFSYCICVIIIILLLFID